MPDLPSRDDWERKLARLLGRFFGERLNDLIGQLGDPPNLNNVSREWYDSLDEVQVPLQDVLQTVYLESAEGQLNSQPIGVDWGLVNERAVQWAKEYSFELVKDINETTRRTLQKVIPTAFEGEVTLGDLQNSLSGTFGPVRATLIAQTEITRAASQGTAGFKQELRKEGVQVDEIHHTNNDDRVCVICGPRDGQVIENDSQRPPLHPGCRCWSTLEARLPNG